MSRYYKKLLGKNIYLSPANLDDVETFTKWINDSAISDNLGRTRFLYSEDKERKFLENADESAFFFSIIDNANDRLIGTITLFEIVQVNRTATLGIFIGEKENHGKGYGAEALNLLLGFAFNTLNLNNVMLKVFDFNEHAVGCYKKVGFKEIGKRRNAYFARGKYHGEIYMDILEEEWRIQNGTVEKQD